MQAPTHGGACALCKHTARSPREHWPRGCGCREAGQGTPTRGKGEKKHRWAYTTRPGGCLGPRRGQPPFCGAGPARLGPPDPAQPGRLGCFSDFQPFISPDVFPMKSLKISKKAAICPPPHKAGCPRCRRLGPAAPVPRVFLGASLGANNSQRAAQQGQCLVF